VKALVFGSTGQVAQELRLRLRDAVFLPRAEADLRDPEACAAAIAATDADVVINAAAYTAVDQAESDDATALLVNGAAPGAMARAAAARGIPFLHVSTDYVFDGTGAASWHPDDETGPLGAYGRSKLAGEHGIHAAGGRFVILRTSWVFSATGHNFLKTMLRLGAERQELRIVADQIGGPTPADAIASALLTIATRFAGGTGISGTYHFSGRPDTNWAAFARAIFAASGQKVAVQDIATADYPTPARRPANSRLDCSSLQRDYGIERPHWREAVARISAKRQ
jgi:dTDP-4-dehydrorhamnose reductase